MYIAKSVIVSTLFVLLTSYSWSVFTLLEHQTLNHIAQKCRAVIVFVGCQCIRYCLFVSIVTIWITEYTIHSTALSLQIVVVLFAFRKSDETLPTMMLPGFPMYSWLPQYFFFMLTASVASTRRVRAASTKAIFIIIFWVFPKIRFRCF